MAVLPTLSAEFTKTYSYDLTPENRKGKECLWKMEGTRPFDELILSWNGWRPARGKWNFWVSLSKGENWSPWIQYAEWAPHSQRTFQYAPQGSWVEGYQDAVYPKDGQCNAFQVKVTAEGGATLEAFDTLYVCLSSLSSLTATPPAEPLPSTLLSNVPRRSQMKLDHPRARDFCSPTAATTAINYLIKDRKADPISFAGKIHDNHFDIYGNWILNTAQAYMELGGRFQCQTQRLNDFSSIHSYLMRRLPVVASVRGPLQGSSHPLTFGHLICIVGYDAEKQRVLCIDSGFPEDEETFVGYGLNDFIEAWGRRQNIAYIFTPKNLEASLAKMMG